MKETDEGYRSKMKIGLGGKLDLETETYSENLDNGKVEFQMELPGYENKKIEFKHFNLVRGAIGSKKILDESQKDQIFEYIREKETELTKEESGQLKNKLEDKLRKDGMEMYYTLFKDGVKERVQENGDFWIYKPDSAKIKEFKKEADKEDTRGSSFAMKWNIGRKINYLLEDELGVDRDDDMFNKFEKKRKEDIYDGLGKMLYDSIDEGFSKEEVVYRFGSWFDDFLESQLVSWQNDFDEVTDESSIEEMRRKRAQEIANRLSDYVVGINDEALKKKVSKGLNRGVSINSIAEGLKKKEDVPGLSNLILEEHSSEIKDLHVFQKIESFNDRIKNMLRKEERDRYEVITLLTSLYSNTVSFSAIDGLEPMEFSSFETAKDINHKLNEGINNVNLPSPSGNDNLGDSGSSEKSTDVQVPVPELPK